MKLIPIKCPNCMAKLDIMENAKVVTCDHCGYDIMVDDEVKRIKLEDAEQTGYELGKGMQRALQEADEVDDGDPNKPPKNKELLIQQLEETREHLAKTIKVEKKRYEAQKKYNEAKNEGNGCLITIGVISLLISWIFSSITAFCIVVAMVLLIVGSNNSRKSRIAEASKVIEECDQVISENRATVPYKYVWQGAQDLESLDSILSILKRGRADSWKESLNLYVLDEHNRETLASVRRAEALAEKAAIHATVAANNSRK